MYHHSRSSDSIIPLVQQHDTTPSLRRDRIFETRPQSDIAGESSSIYTSQHFTFSQFCLQETDKHSRYPSEPAYVSASTYPNHPHRLSSSHGSVVRAVGSQLVTVLKDDRKMVRRSTISAIARKLAEQKSEWMDDEDPEAGEEELLKQREHRSKATKVLALLQLEQEALEKEEQEEKERQEKVLEEEQESVRRAHLQLETLAAEMDEDEEEEEEPIEWDRETISSEIWAWTHVEDNGRCYREDMHALVTKFEEANRKVWREVIHRHQPSRSSGSSPSSAQLRGGKYDILRLQSKRQHQLKECIEVQNHWHIMRALQTHNQDH